MTRSILISAVFVFHLFAIFSCSKTTGNASSIQGSSFPVEPLLPESRINNLAYGSHSQQTLDLFLPYGRNSGKTKLLILIHGGQWTGGDKSNMEGYISILKTRLPDFAFASINYRLIDGSGIRFPAPEQDVVKALSFLWANSDSLGISDKTVILGESAGGQLALLNAYKLSPSRIKVAIGVKSPTRLASWYNTAANPQIKPLLELVTGGTPVTQPQIYFDSSPLNFVGSGAPATLLIHGSADGFVLTQQATDLSMKLGNHSVIHQLILLPGEAHAFSLVAQLQIYDLIADFLSDGNLYK